MPALQLVRSARRSANGRKADLRPTALGPKNQVRPKVVSCGDCQFRSRCGQVNRQWQPSLWLDTFTAANDVIRFHGLAMLETSTK